MNKTGWKVVSRSVSGDLISARIPQDSAWCVTYPVGVRTEGRAGTPVLVFNSQRAAKEFAYSRQPIYKARLENPRRIRSLVQIWNRQFFGRFWRREETPDWDSIFSSPPGTLACDAITLLEPA